VNELSRGLGELLAAHESIGSPLSKSLRPGRDPAEIQTTFAELGLMPPEQVVSWFAWHEYHRDAWQAAGGKADPELFWFGWPMNLDEAVRTYRDYEQTVDRYVDPADPTPDTEQWRSTWFPLLWSSPAVIVVECDSAPAGPAPIRRLENQPLFPPGPAAPVIFPSLVELVAAAVRSVGDHSAWEQGTLQIRDGTDGLIEHY
jgi:hypothetical protein